MFYRFSHFVVSLLIYPFYRFKVEGLEKIPKDGPLIVCVNHKNNLDAVFVACAMERELSFMAKKELFEKKAFRKLILSLNAFPVDRKRNDMAAIRKSVDVLKNGGCLCIFPRGTRDQNLPAREDMKDGVGLIALRAKTNILPIYLDSTYKPFRRSRAYVRDVIDVSKYDNIKLKDAVSLVMDQVYYGLYNIEK